ncbi:hypothetical protein [Pedobacter steynii]|nr:hypothetical protein [Pedobacter steynii]
MKTMLAIMNETADQENTSVQQTRQILTMPSIKKHKDQEVFKVIVMSLAKSYTDLGMTQPTQKDKDYLANELADLIPRKFPSIRLAEIPLAFSRGIRGKFGPYYGLNVVSFEKFVEAHLSCESREQLARDALLKKESRIPDKDSRFNVARDNAINAMHMMNSGKEVLSGAIVYDFLDRLALISFNNREKWEFVAEARRYLNESLGREQRRTISRIKQTEIQRKLNSVQDGSAIEMIKSMAKRFALYAFFRSCILDELDLKEIIEQQRPLFI